MLTRVVQQLTTALRTAQTLLEAYEYHLVCCLEAGLSPEAAATAWQLHSSEAFEAEIVEAESSGPNAMRMIDARILHALGIAPYEHSAEGGADRCP